MYKNEKKYVFRNVDGMWQRVDSQEPMTLADFLTQYEIIIDNRTQFARLYDFERNICIWYRAYNMAKVVITIHDIEE